MSHQIHEGDVAFARTLLLARRPETQVVAALVYRGVENSAAAQAVELLRRGDEPDVMISVYAGIVFGNVAFDQEWRQASLRGAATDFRY
jgi:hypothetical protein